MKPVFQTRFGLKNGNCFQACLASLLELELDEVPDLMTADKKTYWLDALNDWLRPRGWAAVLVTCVNTTLWSKGLTMIAGGRSPHGKGEHAVLWQDDKCVHDPLPEGGGLKGEPKDLTVLVPLDPAKFFLRGRPDGE